MHEVACIVSERNLHFGEVLVQDIGPISFLCFAGRSLKAMYYTRPQPWSADLLIVTPSRSRTFGADCHLMVIEY